MLYGSESELDGSDDEAPTDRNARPGKPKNNSGGARIRMDDDEPMDLLHGAAARLTSMSWCFVSANQC